MKNFRCVFATLLGAGILGLIAIQIQPIRSAIKTRVIGRYVDLDPCVIAPGKQFTIDYYGLTYYGDSSTLIDQELLCHGDWGLTELAFLSEAARISGADQAIFVDVGANSGLYSLYLSRLVATVHSFDPYLPVLDRFRKSIAASEVSNVVVHPVGLGEAEADLPFNEPPPGNMGTGSFVPGFKVDNAADGLVLKVVQGDNYFAANGIEDFDVFKIDTEGFEKPVLLGLRETLARVRPTGTIEFSFTPGLEHAFRDRQDLLDSLPENYSVFAVREGKDGGFVLTPFAPNVEEGQRFQETVAIIPDEESARFEMWVESSGL